MNGARVVIVEDHALVRTGLRTSLRANGFEVAGEAPDGIIGERLIAELKPDVAIIDLEIPGKGGIDVTRSLKLSHCSTRIVILTMREDELTVIRALSAGADGYCVKSSELDTILDAIRTVAAGGAFFDPSVSNIVLRRLTANDRLSATSPLTARETEVLNLVARGVSNAEIATELHVSLGTVKAHVAEILRTLSASDRAHASAIALRNGFIA
jgi:NarL family two-component system response regulator LiaR